MPKHAIPAGNKYRVHANGDFDFEGSIIVNGAVYIDDFEYIELGEGDWTTEYYGNDLNDLVAEVILDTKKESNVDLIFFTSKNSEDAVKGTTEAYGIFVRLDDGHQPDVWLVLTIV